MNIPLIYTYKISFDFLEKFSKSKIDFFEIQEIEKFQNNKIILTSINILQKNDYEICEKLINKNAKIIVFTTKNTTSKSKEILLKKGVNAFININSDIFDLLSIVNLISNKNTIIDKNSISHYDNLIEIIPNPTFIKDKKHKFIACNTAFCKYLGIAKNKIIGKSAINFTNYKAAQIYEEIDEVVLKTGSKNRHEGEVLHSNNKIQDSIINKSLLYDSEKNIVGIIGILTDITDRKKEEKKLKAVVQKAKESDKLKSSFLSNMSHEIRTPMNAIVGFSQLLNIPHLTNEKKEIYVEQINKNTNKLLKLIEDIIEVSKIEAGKIKINKTVCYVNQLLNELCISFTAHKARLGKAHIKLITKPAIQEETFNIITDPYRLNQIITNLLGNAIKFTDRGSIEFGYNLKLINNKNVVEFYVKDTGLGINKDKIKYVFDRFSKIAASKTKLYGGTGIGLSISKSLTELLGGQILVKSVENEGTTFIFHLPYISKKENKIILDNINREIYVEKVYNWEGITILIAEDEEMNFLYLKEALSETKANLIWKKNGRNAVNEIKNNKNINIVLMDVKMPDMNGYQATKLIKQYNPEIPVIIQTAYALKKERKKGFRYGCDDYLEKPVLQDVLLKVIDKHLTNN